MASQFKKGFEMGCRYMQTSKVSGKDIAIFIGLTLLYFILGKLGLRLAFVHVSATAVWPPTALALFAMLFLGYRFWPAIFLGAFLVNITTAGNFFTTLGIAAGNTLEGVFGAYLLNQFVRGKNSLNNSRNILKFVFFAGILSTMVSPTMGVTSLTLGGYAQPKNYFPIWFTWWLGDLVSNLTFAPFLILWFNTRRFIFKLSDFLYAIFLGLAIPFINLVVFGGFIPGLEKAYPLEFLVIPFVVLVAFKFKHKGAATAMIPISAFAIWGTLHGFGPFANWQPNQSLLLLQIFLGVVSLTGLVVGSIVSESEEEKSEIEIEKRRLEKLIENLPVGVSFLEAPSGNPIMFNKRAKELMGRSIDTRTGEERYQETYKLFRENGGPYPNEELPAVISLKKGIPVSKSDVVVRKPGGTNTTLKVSSVPIFDRKGDIASVLVVFDDITKEKELERAKSEFISVVSHQLRTPLGNMRWNLEMLLNEKKRKISKETESSLLDIYDSTRKLIDLVNDILNVSHIETDIVLSSPEYINAAGVVTKAVKDILPYAQKKGVKVTFKKNTDGKIYIDQKRFLQVIQNLLSNAVNYNTNNGQVEVILDKLDGNIRLIVKDTGIGIPERDKGKIFTKFFRAENAVKSHVEGTGLGLYIVKSFILKMGGKISFTSTEGLGSKFVVILPTKR